MVWSDPDDRVEAWAVSPRGAGWLFGSKVTNDFMQRNNLKLICRAHQLVHEGNRYNTFCFNSDISRNPAINNTDMKQNFHISRL